MGIPHLLALGMIGIVRRIGVAHGVEDVAVSIHFVFFQNREDLCHVEKTPH
jgi:hypothetical protein